MKPTGTTLLGALPDLMLLFDEEGTCIDFHRPPCCDSFPVHPVTDRPLLDAFEVETHKTLIPAFSECQSQRHIVEREFSCQVTGRDRQFFELRVLPCGEHLFMALVRDVTEQKKEREILYRDAYHDPLTRLPNRAQFMSTLKDTLVRARERSDHMLAVLMLDMDKFKSVNDSLGHLVGDQLLIDFGNRLSAQIRNLDMVARLGGDEFVILLDKLKTPAQAVMVANRIHEAMKRPFPLADKEIFTSTSIGIALACGGYSSAEDLLRDSDLAMYKAKASGRGQSAMFEDQMHAQNLEILNIETALRRAVPDEQLRLCFQTVHSIPDNRIAILEALLRWQHPQRGLLLPAEFLHVADETGEIMGIGHWVFRKSVETLTRIKEAERMNLAISVNLSGRQLSEDELPGRIVSYIAEAGLPPSTLMIETTEKAISMDPVRHSKALRRLKDAGFRIILDNFGTGFSSLNYLVSLPLNLIKVDRSFIASLENRAETRMVVSSVIRLGHELGIKVIAEGVETQAQKSILLDMGCDLAQGYGYFKPAPQEAIIAILNGQSAGMGSRMTWA